MSSRHDSNGNASQGGRDHEYQRSPYPISILPRIQLSKPRPKVVRTVDVAPTPLKDDGDGDLSGGDDESNHIVHVDGSTTHDVTHCDFAKEDPSPSTPMPCQNNNDKETDTDGRSMVEIITTLDATETMSPQSTRRIRREQKQKSISANNSTIPPRAKMIIEVIGSESHQNANATALEKTNQISKCQKAIICNTCNQNEARYTCPKCKAPYCSVSCYRIHDESKVCTELFFKDHVLKGLNSSKDGSDKLHGILARMHRDINDNLDDVDKREHTISGMLQGDNDNENGIVSGMRSDIQDNAHSYQSSSVMRLENKDSSEIISDEDLAELAEYVLQMGDDDGELDVDGDEDEHGKRLLDSIPAHLLHAFECALASATEASDSPLDEGASVGKKDVKDFEDAWSPFIERDNMGVPVESHVQETSITNNDSSIGREWTLWWLPDQGVGAGNDENNFIPSSPAPTLDERILALPPLPKLSSSNNQNTSLSFNILEVLYAMSFVVRVKSNTSEKDDNDIDEAALLLAQSSVLSHDARYDSVREALVACAEQLVGNKKPIPLAKLRSTVSTNDNGGKQEKTLSWDDLASDVAKISYHRRYVLRMLFEALDTCQIGLDRIKARLKKIKAKKHKVLSAAKNGAEKDKREYEESKRQYKLAVKKLEYFLSWCSSQWSAEMGSELSEEVLAFVADWQKEDAPAEESSVEQLIRGIHTTNICDDDNGTAGLGGILDFGGVNNAGLRPMVMDEQMISVSTVRKKLPQSQ